MDSPVLQPDSRPQRPPTPRPRPRAPEPGFRHYLLAAIGSILIGVTLPALLTALRLCLLNKYAGERLQNFALLQAAAFFGCSPGAVILSMLLMAFLTMKANKWTAKRSIVTGGLCGIGVAFLNLPGYGAFMFLWEDDSPAGSIARVVLLFIVAGITCGMWIGWQAWRGFRPTEGFLPRFSLRTLLLVVMMWGTVLVAFQPDRRDQFPQPVPPTAE